MSQQLPPQPAYRSGAPSQAALLERREQLRAGHDGALARVGSLARTQEELSKGLSAELRGMQADGRQLDLIETRQAEAGLLSFLTRSLGRRRSLLARQSVSESLLRRYEAASLCLRQASAFCDELQLCGLELHQQVEALHRELQGVGADEQAAAQRILALAEALEDLPGTGLSTEDLAMARDRLRFEERNQSAALGLLQARAALVRKELGPARQLRDTVMVLHRDLAGFVLQATSAVDTAGRRIQALGMAADAPTVVAELHDSLAGLSEAMRATEEYVRSAQDLVTRVLPELSAQLETEHEAERLALSGELEQLGSAQARAMADRALEEAARAEVDELLGKTL